MLLAVTRLAVEGFLVGAVPWLFGGFFGDEIMLLREREGGFGGELETCYFPPITKEMNSEKIGKEKEIKIKKSLWIKTPLLVLPK